MTRRGRRLTIIGVAGVLLIAAAVLVLRGLNDSVVFFYAPAELAAKAKPGERVRVGGLVAEGSVHKENGQLLFVVTDNVASIPVRYPGHPPDLFKEKQGVVAEGRWTGAEFEADRVLAKHDENYVPKEVAEALKKRGEWRGE